MYRRELSWKGRVGNVPRAGAAMTAVPAHWVYDVMQHPERHLHSHRMKPTVLEDGPFQ